MWRIQVRDSIIDDDGNIYVDIEQDIEEGDRCFGTGNSSTDQGIGRIPQTGQSRLIYSTLYGAIAFVLLLIIIVLIKRRNEEEEEVNEENT